MKGQNKLQIRKSTVLEILLFRNGSICCMIGITKIINLHGVSQFCPDHPTAHVHSPLTWSHATVLFVIHLHIPEHPFPYKPGLHESSQLKRKEM